MNFLSKTIKQESILQKNIFHFYFSGKGICLNSNQTWLDLKGEKPEDNHNSDTIYNM